MVWHHHCELDIKNISTDDGVISKINAAFFWDMLYRLSVTCVLLSFTICV